MRGWVVALLATAVFVAVAAVGLIAIVVSGDERTAIVDLDVGDCFELPADRSTGELDAVEVVDCAEPHDAEVVARGQLNESGDMPYPDDPELFALVDDACRGVLVDAAFGLLPIAPTEAVWESFEGRYLCVAVPFGGERVTGSIDAG